MRIEKTRTGYIIYDPTPLIKDRCLQYFSLNTPLREFFTYCKDDNGKNERIYITSGFGSLKDFALRSALSDYKEIKAPMGDKIELTQERSPRSQLQKDCIEKLTTTSAAKVTVELKPGVGKAEPYSRKIPVPDSKKGFKLMGDLKVGDEVFDCHGNPSYINGIFEQGIQDVYKITFSDGRTAMCTDSHLWTIRKNNKGKWITDLTQNIMKYYKRKKCYIPSCLPVNYSKTYVPMDAWVLGCFIGNGCLTSNQLQIYSASDEIPTIIAEKYGYIVKKMKDTHSYLFYNEYDLPILTSEFFKKIPELCVSSSKKFIPESYMYNDVDTRMHLLQGMMDANGIIDNSGDVTTIKFPASSQKLLKHISLIMYSLGFTCRVEEVSESEGPYFGRLIFDIPESAKHYLFSTMSKRLHVLSMTNADRYTNSFEKIYITDISYSHQENCRCIMVNNPEHLYLTQDYIVTHNTFMSLYSISKLGLKPLIVTPSTLLKNQWIENLTDSGIPKEDIATTIFDGAKKKFTVVTISSIENAMRDDFEGTIKAVADGRYGIKIIDEAHLHLKGMLRFDPLCNIQHNWYLSATLGRSDPQEDSILNRALSDAERFIGSSMYDEYKHEYVNIYLQDIVYRPTNALCRKHFKYGKKGLIRATYYNMLMDYNHGKPFINNIIKLIKGARKICPYGKILVLVPLINIIDAVIEEMKKDPFFTNKQVVGVDGSMSIAEKRKALECEFILSTSMSMGVGVDVADLSCVINFDQYSSPIIGEQIFGRLRTRKDGKETYYFDICDKIKQARQVENWGRKRRVLLPYFPGANPDLKILPRIIS